jgi:sigma-B regulation protein RsbU (phosphoserine phosphatase)
MSQHDQPLNDAPMLLRLLNVARQLAMPFDLEDLLRVIVDEGRAALRAERGSVFLHDAQTQELYTIVATGVESIRVSVNEGLAGLCARERRIINIDDCYADPRFNRAMDARTGFHTHCCISIPLIGVDEEMVGVLQMLNAADGSFNDDDVVVADVVAAMAATAIQRVRLLDERLAKLKLERDIALAKAIQTALLPRVPATCPGYDLAGFNRPADDTGGDIYDIIRVDPHDAASMLVLLMADATGHGIGPALSVSQLRAMVRVGLRYTTSLEHLIVHLNEQLASDLPEGRFITAFVGELNPAEHRLTYHAAGQGPLLWRHAATGTCDMLGATTLPLAVVPDLPAAPPEAIDLAPGDVVALLTDGFYEFMNRQEEQYGQQRVAAAIDRLAGESAHAILHGLLDDLQHWAGDAPQGDDLTAIILKRCE